MRKIFFFVIVLTIFLPNLSHAQSALGEEKVFNIESSYDLSQRDELTATLVRISPTAYWYMDKNLSAEEVGKALDPLVIEFEDNIYPILTRTFGSEWKPGIDKDDRITILIHPMKKEAGGYINTSDEYPKLQIPESNEREMLYLNSEYINTERAKSFLAHEFMHLITFNQKEKQYGVIEEEWLNEVRAEYAPTLLGYDNKYQGSNLQNRVADFLNKSSDSLTEWKEVSSDYGVANLFVQYLADHYGISVLADSLKMKKTGIESINAVLLQNGFKEDFSQIFTNWAIAVLINDCQVSDKYCYFNENLKDFRVTPLVNYLPFVGDSTLSVVNTTRDWAGNWHKFVGGNGTLQLSFQAGGGTEFQVPYVIQSSHGDFTVGYLPLDENGEGKISVQDFGSKNVSLTIIPISQNKVSNFSSIEPSRMFSWTASTKEKEETSPIPSLSPLRKPISQMTRSELIARINEAKKVLLALQKLLLEIEGGISCQSITQDLYFGMKGNLQVKCLQEFLKSQGTDIYPEGITNGNFYTLTQNAVIRFQEKYKNEILTPWNLNQGTGYVGSSTRAKINKLLTK